MKYNYKKFEILVISSLPNVNLPLTISVEEFVIPTIIQKNGKIEIKEAIERNTCVQTVLILFIFTTRQFKLNNS